MLILAAPVDKNGNATSFPCNYTEKANILSFAANLEASVFTSDCFITS